MPRWRRSRTYQLPRRSVALVVSRIALTLIHLLATALKIRVCAILALTSHRLHCRDASNRTTFVSGVTFLSQLRFMRQHTHASRVTFSHHLHVVRNLPSRPSLPLPLHRGIIAAYDVEAPPIRADSPRRFGVILTQLIYVHLIQRESRQHHQHAALCRGCRFSLPR